MTIVFDMDTDVLRILLRDAPIAESDDEHADIFIDYDESSNIVGIEILDATQRVASPQSVEYAITGLGKAS